MQDPLARTLINTEVHGLDRSTADDTWGQIEKNCKKTMNSHQKTRVLLKRFVGLPAVDQSKIPEMEIHAGDEKHAQHECQAAPERTPGIRIFQRVES